MVLRSITDKRQHLKTIFETLVQDLPEKNVSILHELTQKCQSGINSQWKDEKTSKTAKEKKYRLFINTLVLYDHSFDETKLLNLMVKKSKHVKRHLISPLLDNEEYKDYIASRIRLTALSPESCLLLMYDNSLSINQYTRLATTLYEKGFKILVNGNYVSKLQAELFRLYGRKLKLKVLPSKMGVAANVNYVLQEIFKYIDEMKLHKENLEFALRIDGRPVGPSFDVVFSISVLHNSKEIVFYGSFTCIPLLIYEGGESLEEIMLNASKLLEELHTQLIDHKCILTIDMAMYWDFVGKGKCPYCDCEKPEQRFHCLHQASKSPIHGSDNEHLNFWLLVFVVCVLHMKLRIVNHFVEHLTRLTLASRYWLANLYGAFTNINLRYRIYGDKINENKFRVPAYKGNECDKIIAKANLLIDAAVSPTTDIQGSWKKPKIEEWMRSRRQQWPKNCIYVADKEAHVFSLIAEEERKLPNNLTTRWKKLWTGIFQQLRRLENGIDMNGHPEYLPAVLEQIAIQNSTLKTLWDEILTTKTYHNYEHVLLDHMHKLLACFPEGLKSRSQSSMERTHGDQVLFTNKNLFNSTWKRAVSSYEEHENAVENEAENFLCIDTSKEVYPIDWNGRDRAEIKNLIRGKKTNAVLGIDNAKKEQLSRTLAFPFIKKYLIDHVAQQEEATAGKRSSVTNPNRKKVRMLPPLKIIKKP